MTISRRRFLGTGAELTAASLVAAAPSAHAADAAAPFRFLSIGDWGRNGTHHQSTVAGAMAERAEKIDPRFILSLGDNFYESGVTSVNDPQWKSSFEDIYTQASLQRPWKVILGNHDYRGNVPAQLEYSKRSTRWELPDRYYQRTESAPGGGAEIFFLDTSPFIRKYVGTVTNIVGQDPHAQRAWLDDALGRSTARWKIVVGHHPLFTALGGHGHDQPDMIAALEPVLRRHKVPLYINGHDHSMQYVEMGGIAYVTNGVGSEIYDPGTPSRPGFCLGAHGFLQTEVTANAISLAFIDMHGKTRFAKTISG